MRLVILFIAQLFGMLLISLNIRALSKGKRAETAITEFSYALISFYVLHRIAEARSWHEAVTYAAGATTGSYLALVLSGHWEGR